MALEIYIQTSIYEGFSLAATEARAFGLKLALSNTSGTKELINNYSSSIVLELDKKADLLNLNKLTEIKYVNDFSARHPFTKEKFMSKINNLYINE